MVELTMFILGIGLYVSSTRARDRIGQYGFYSYAGLLLLLYLGDRFSPPPGNVGELIWSGLIAELILIPWAWWFDHHRQVLPEVPLSR